MTSTIASFLALLLMAQAQGPAFKAPPPRFDDPDRAAVLARAYPEIDRLFRQYAAEAHVPGAAWGIIVDGRLAANSMNT